MKNRINNIKVMEAVNKHILESLLDEGQTPEVAAAEYYEQLETNVKGMPEYKKYKVKNLQNVVKYTVQGCYKYFEFENYKIDEFLQSLNISRYDSLKSDDEKNELYYYLMYKGTERLLKAYNLNF